MLAAAAGVALLLAGAHAFAPIVPRSHSPARLQRLAATLPGSCDGHDHLTHAASEREQQQQQAGVERRQFLAAAASACAALASAPLAAGAIGELPETAGQQRFVQHAVLNVPDVEAAVRFYTEGLGMRVLRSRSDRAANTNTTFVGFGPEQLTIPKAFAPGVSSFAEYGGHFSLELVGPLTPAADGELPYYDPGDGVQYIQMGVDNYRISKVIANGGEVIYGYGYLQIIAPGGVKLNVFSGVRRDPMMFVAIKVSDLKKSIAWYRDVLAMSEFPYPRGWGAPDSVFEPKQPKDSVFMAYDADGAGAGREATDSVFEPKQPKDSVFMGYDADGAGVLLIPRERKDRAPINIGSAYGKLAILGTNVEEEGRRIGAAYAGKAPGTDTSVAVTADPDGYTVVLVEYADFAREL